MPYQSLWKAADLPYNYITAGNRLGTLKIEYQQYGEPPGQTSVEQCAPRPGGGCEVLPGERSSLRRGSFGKLPSNDSVRDL